MASNKLMKRYFVFSKKEIKEFLLTSLVLTFILFFFAWNSMDYTVVSAIFALIQFFIIVLGSLFLFISASKWFAIHRHYTAHYKGWLIACLIGFVVSFTSYGFVPLLFPGLIEVTRIDRLRHGKTFPGENKYDIFTILAMAPLASMTLAVFMQFFYQTTNLEFFYYTMVFNAALAFFSLLPFAKNIGAHLFYTNKRNYVLLLFISLAFFILVLFNVFFSLVFAILIGAILFLVMKKPLKNYDL